MTKKIFKTIFILSTIIGISLILSSNTPVFAACDNVCDPSCTGVPQAVKDAAGCDSTTANQLPGIVQGILNAVIAISGLVAVVFIVIGGIKYMTSTGDANKLKSARDTIIYSVIGLVICVLAFAIVNWTIAAINNAPANTTDPADTTDPSDPVGPNSPTDKDSD